MKNKRGGKRKGAGAKPRYSEATKTIAFRCPVSKIPEVRAWVVEKMKDYRTRE